VSERQLCAVDVDYRRDGVVAAGVGFTQWTDATPLFEKVVRSATPAASYEPGQFYLREMPYLIDLVRRLPALPDVLVVDGFVWLGPGIPGLGARLYEALHRRVAVVGVAKRPYRDHSMAAAVVRGKSRQPLFVSAVGMELAAAAQGVARMHGPYRIPTLLKRADRLSRDAP
jgi:deoxyribonuclease V